VQPTDALVNLRLGDVQAKWVQAVLSDAVTGMRRVIHGHIACPFLVVVDLINIVDVLLFRSKDDPPVCRHGYTPEFPSNCLSVDVADILVDLDLKV